MQKFKFSTKKLLELVNHFSNAVGYKVNAEKVTFLFANDELTERENQEWNLTHITLKNKYLK